VRIEMGGDLFFAFEQSPVGIGEGIGLLAAAIILFLAFGSLIATALAMPPAGGVRRGYRWRCASTSPNSRCS